MQRKNSSNIINLNACKQKFDPLIQRSNDIQKMYKSDSDDDSCVIVQNEPVAINLIDSESDEGEIIESLEINELKNHSNIKEGAFEPLSDGTEESFSDDLENIITEPVKITKKKKRAVEYEYLDPFGNYFRRLYRVTPKEEDSSDSEHDYTNLINIISSGVKEPKYITKEILQENRILYDDEFRDLYYHKRYDLFERFDMGIRMDKDAWMFETPEQTAKEQALKCLETDYVFVVNCCAGSNVIQFVNRCKEVLAIDDDLLKTSQARHNAMIYGIDMEKVFIDGETFDNYISLYEHCMNTNNKSRFPTIDVIFIHPYWDSRSIDHDIEKLNVPNLLIKSRKLHVRLIMIHMPSRTPDETMQTLALDNENFSCDEHTVMIGGRPEVLSKTYCFESTQKSQ